MDNNPEQRHVLVYEHVQSRLNTIVSLARRAAWTAHGFNSEQLALEEFTDNIDALIVGARGDFTKSAFKGNQLLKRANELDIPRALLVNNLRQAQPWVRPDSPDLLLNAGARTSNNMRILTGWLQNLAVEIKPSSE